MSATIAPLLAGLFIVLAIGVALRAFARMGQAQADTINTIIVDVAMPALIVSVLAKRDLEWSTAIALVPATIALFVSGACALLITRALGYGRVVQGSAALVASFCNTGFLGFPLLLALFPGNATASYRWNSASGCSMPRSSPNNSQASPASAISCRSTGAAGL